MTNPPAQAMTLQAALQQAVEHHRAGRLHEAEQLYRAILQKNPAESDANHNLGLIAVHVGRHDVALGHFKAALEALPQQEQYLQSYAGTLIACSRFAQAMNVLQKAMQQGARSAALQVLYETAEAALSATGASTTVFSQQDAENLFSLFNAGRHIEAETLARQQLEHYPESGFLWKVLGASLQMQGKDALPALHKAVALLPGEADGHNNLGVAFQRMGRHAEAAASSLRALQLNPAFAEAHRNLGTALYALRELEQAAASYRRALAIKPDLDTWVNLGVTLRDLGQHQHALAAFSEAEKFKPDSAVVHNHMANALLELGQIDAAATHYRRAISLDPQFAFALNSLGNLLQSQHHCEEAEALYRQALAARPEYAEAHNNRGVALRELARYDEAIASFERAIACKANFVEAYSNLGSALLDAGRVDDAIASCRKAVQLNTDFAEAHSNLGHVLHVGRRYDEALACFLRALEINPNFADAHSNLGALQRDMGKLEAALESCRRALQLKPGFIDAHSNLLFSSNYLATQEPAALLADARRFGAAAAQGAHPFTSWPNLPDAKRTLRLGMVSGDLYNHPVGFFLDQTIAALAEECGGRLDIFAYSNRVESDALTERIKSHCAAWRNVVGMSDRKLAQQIREDGIDILLDLSGHTSNNRLAMFAWKAAPIQASWLGYFATTGLDAIDYLIADPWTLPPSEEKFFTEKIWRLPETRLCFSAPDIALDVAPLPAHGNGSITFGCFNNLSKINDAVVALWCDILDAIPDSRLFLKNMQFGEPGARQAAAERFAARGIDAARLILEGPSSREQYLRSYDRIDIALDPFPYTGGTTTAEALWMGVPVLSLAGQRFLSRQGAGLLANAGLPGWVAKNTVQYIALAVSHAADIEQLSALRKNLRGRVLASPIFDAGRFAIHFETMLRNMWRSWCKQQRALATPESNPRVASEPTQQETDHLIALFHAGRHAEVERAALQILAEHPDSGVTWKVYGAALQLLGKDALAALRKAVALSPGDAYACNNLALALMERRQIGESIHWYRRALQIAPDMPEAHSNLGNALQALGDAEQAAASCRRALALKPDYAEALSNLGNALRDLKQLDEAVASCRKALTINPNLAPAWSNLGNALRDQRNVPEAIDCYQRALQVNPRMTDARHNLGLAFHGQGKFEAAIGCHHQVLQADPAYPDIYSDIANSQRELGNYDEAIVCYRKALELKPDSLEVRGDMLFTLNYQADVARETVIAEARRYGEVASRRARPYSKWGSNLDNARRLRIGFVSGDLHAHPVGYFIEGICAALANDFSASLELIGYPTRSVNDAVSNRIRSCCAAWYPAQDLTDEQLAAQIHNDRIDILFDLSGHTLHNRLPVFAWKPAPIQVCWLGYVATSGLAAMDYYLADAYAAPASQDAQFLEKVWRMPESMVCLTPPSLDLPVTAPPALTNGFVTFGSFNNLAKVSDLVIRLWSQILHSVPGSKLLLNTRQLGDPALCETTWRRFATQGIARERVMLEFVTPRANSLAAYSRIDIALDPFPYNGGTTTAEALWMGVPVLTLAGERLVARMGASQLSNAGLADWIAMDMDDYVAKARALADVPTLATLRAGLRRRVLESPLFDAPRFAAHLDSALRAMWMNWCNAHGQ
ncbi:MAG TPA: tetratricopeptide repeat protein [Burkholderiaceae bacterium]